jgi:regulatory protein YycI of two-component signal transduction system YycFG
MNDQKNLFIAIFLVIAILIGYQFLAPSSKPQPQAPGAQQVTQQAVVQPVSQPVTREAALKAAPRRLTIKNRRGYV